MSASDSAAAAAAAEAEEERAVFDDDDDEDTDDSEFDDDDDTDPDDLRRPNPAPTPNPAPIPAATPPTIPNPVHPASPPNGTIQQPSPLPSATAEPKIEERRPLVPFDDSRRLFQRLWTDDDEIKILRGFLEFTTSRGTAFASHQYDTGPFYERIKRELQLDFTKNQLIEKLRRLKKKFRNAAARIAAGKDAIFKSPHDQATYDISRKIWSAGLKRSSTGADSDDDLGTNPHPPSISVSDPNTDSSRTRRRRTRRRIEETPVEVPVAVEDHTKTVLAQPPPPPPAPVPHTIIEETVKSCLGPLFKEMMNSVVGAQPGLGLNFGGPGLNSLLPLGAAGSLLSLLPPPLVGAVEDEKWRKQRILELEVFAKRIDLLQEQIKSTLEELKSPPAAAES